MKSTNTVIILGTSRNGGETQKIVNKMVEQTGWAVINLNDYKIGYYDYNHNNKEDDYLTLMKSIIDNYDTLIFATPVYWYAMSGMMKVFFDRFSDLLTIEKELGRRLKGIRMAAISSSVGNNLGADFWLAFTNTAEYLGMQYLGNLHTIVDKEDDKALYDFIDKCAKR